MKDTSPLDEIKNWPQLNTAASLLMRQITAFDVHRASEGDIELLQKQISAWQTLVQHSDSLLAATDPTEHHENLQQLSDQNRQLVKLCGEWREALSAKLSGQLKTRNALNAYTDLNQR